MKRFFLLAFFGIAVALGAMTSAAQAQATRTWVSGVGDDVNPCSRTAPCKTFAGAISKTAAGGEIDALDPGGFGTLTITKAITIDGGGGEVASVLASGTVGFTINAGTNDVVTLRNLRINGAGTTLGTKGVNIVNAGTVRVQNCVIENFSNVGIDAERRPHVPRRDRLDRPEQHGGRHPELDRGDHLGQEPRFDRVLDAAGQRRLGRARVAEHPHASQQQPHRQQPYRSRRDRRRVERAAGPDRHHGHQQLDGRRSRLERGPRPHHEHHGDREPQRPDVRLGRPDRLWATTTSPTTRAATARLARPSRRSDPVQAAAPPRAAAAGRAVRPLNVPRRAKPYAGARANGRCPRTPPPMSRSASRFRERPASPRGARAAGAALALAVALVGSAGLAAQAPAYAPPVRVHLVDATSRCATCSCAWANRRTSTSAWPTTCAATSA